jgi:hypothetical protein
MPRKKLTTSKKTKTAKVASLPRLKPPPLGTLDQYDLYLAAYDKYLAKVVALKDEFRKEVVAKKTAEKSVRKTATGQAPATTDPPAGQQEKSEAQKAARLGRNRRRRERRKEHRLRKNLQKLELETQYSKAKTSLVAAKRSETAVRRVAKATGKSAGGKMNARQRRQAKRKPLQDAYKEKQARRFGRLPSETSGGSPAPGFKSGSASPSVLRSTVTLAEAQAQRRAGGTGTGTSTPAKSETIYRVQKASFGQKCGNCSAHIALPNRGELITCSNCGCRNDRAP